MTVLGDFNFLIVILYHKIDINILTNDIKCGIILKHFAGRGILMTEYNIFLERAAYNWAAEKEELFFPGGSTTISLLEQDDINLRSENCYIALFRAERTLLLIIWPESNNLAIWSVSDFGKFEKAEPQLSEQLLQNGINLFKRERGLA